MKIIDKLIIIGMGMLICLELSWRDPLPLMGLFPIIYAVGYLIILGIDSE